MAAAWWSAMAITSRGGADGARAPGGGQPDVDRLSWTARPRNSGAISASDAIRMLFVQVAAVRCARMPLVKRRRHAQDQRSEAESNRRPSALRATA